ncbi:MAG TPA: ABC transporter permease [Anaerolineaceae bacterium]|nr:ABC transporter permease [Anaerolineaceae bacterium]
MNKTINVARYEYLHHVGNRSFWISLVSVPLGFVLIIVLSMLLSFLAFDTRPVGIVDNGNLIQIKPDNSKPSTFFDPQTYLYVYPDESAARAAALAGEIQGFAVLPEDYTSHFQLTYWTDKQPDSDVQAEITNFISKNLMVAENIDSAVFTRINEGSHISLQSLDGSQTSDGTGWHRIIVPIVIGLLNFIVVMSSGGYLLKALVEEKENRTIEIMLTSVPSREIMAGKIIGNLSVGLTQIIVWVLLLGIAGFIFRNQLEFLADINLSGSYVAISVALMVLSFLFSAALMATIGAAMTSTEESQGVIGLMVIPMMFPFYFFSVFLSNPNGILARVLSFIPLSAPLALSLRMAFSSVSPLEIGLIFVVIILLTLLMFWLSGVVFKRGMLQYSKRLSLKEIFNKETRNA